MLELLFEKIKAWDGVSDTGKDARLKIERNFEKISSFIGVDLDTLLTSMNESIALKASLEALNSLAEIVDDKAEKTAVEELVTALSSKADLINGLISYAQIPDVKSSILVSDFDWSTLFSKNGPWRITDNQYTTSRPEGLDVPEGSQEVKYLALVFGVSEYAEASAILVKPSDGTICLLKKDSIGVTTQKVIREADLNAFWQTVYSELNLVLDDMNSAITNLSERVGDIDTALDDVHTSMLSIINTTSSL